LKVIGDFVLIFMCIIDLWHFYWHLWACIFCTD